MVIATSQQGLGEAPLRLLIDASVVKRGGGVAVSAALAERAAREPSLCVHLVATPAIADQLGDDARRGLAGLSVAGRDFPVSPLAHPVALARIERRFGADFVFTVFGPSYWRARAPRLTGFADPTLVIDPQHLPRAPGERAGALEPLRRAVKRAALRSNGTEFWTETEIFKTLMVRRLGIAPGRIAVIPNAIGPGFAACGAREAGTGPFTVFVPAAYYPHKNLALVARAAALLATRGEGGVRFVLLLEPGGAPMAELVRLAGPGAGLLEARGFVPSSAMPGLYAAADAVLLPSRLEVSSAVFPEAFASRRPLVAADLPYAHALAGPAAEFVDPDDAAALVDALLGLRASPQRRAALVAAGSTRLKDHYLDADTKWARHLALILRLAGRAG